MDRAREKSIVAFLNSFNHSILFLCQSRCVSMHDSLYAFLHGNDLAAMTRTLSICQSVHPRMHQSIVTDGWPAICPSVRPAGHRAIVIRKPSQWRPLRLSPVGREKSNFLIPPTRKPLHYIKMSVKPSLANFFCLVTMGNGIITHHNSYSLSV